MKTHKAWRLGTGEVIMPAPRHRPPSRRPLWIIILVSLVCVLLIGAYVYPPRRYATCYFFSSSVCSPFKPWLPPAPARLLTDDEFATRVVFSDILKTPPPHSKNPKIAFMFLTPGSLPFEKLWEKFFIGHEGRFSIYVHASRKKPEHVSPFFIDRDIHSDKVVWGKISMIDAEKRLLANALQDTDNQHFILLSDSCVPLHNFDYVHNYLMDTNISFIDSFEDPGPHGTGRYSEHMLPEIEKKDWRKGAQWFSMKRQHALLVLADSLYYTKFKLFCKPGMEGRNCYADEHYLPTLFHMVDPNGIANWSVTHVDWSEGKWHPKAYRAQDVTFELLKNITVNGYGSNSPESDPIINLVYNLLPNYLSDNKIGSTLDLFRLVDPLGNRVQSIDESVHVTSEEKKEVQQRPCLWNGVKRPCYLFARKFYPEALDNMMQLFSNYTSF